MICFTCYLQTAANCLQVAANYDPLSEEIYGLDPPSRMLEQVNVESFFGKTDQAYHFN